jgi:very-short-patch-repair endonuclease
MPERKIHNKYDLMDRRRQLRNNPTSAEDMLWQLLKGSKLEGRKFRRQHSIDKFIVDFYCPSEKLAVEVDGSIHDVEAVKKYDAARQKHLEGLGIKVVRVQNDDVFRNMHLVAEAIIGGFANK